MRGHHEILSYWYYYYFLVTKLPFPNLTKIVLFQLVTSRTMAASTHFRVFSRPQNGLVRKSHFREDLMLVETKSLLFLVNGFLTLSIWCPLFREICALITKIQGPGRQKYWTIAHITVVLPAFCLQKGLSVPTKRGSCGHSCPISWHSPKNDFRDALSQKIGDRGIQPECFVSPLLKDPACQPEKVLVVKNCRHLGTIIAPPKGNADTKVRGPEVDEALTCWNEYHFQNLCRIFLCYFWWYSLP